MVLCIGIVVSGRAYGTEDPGFESRQGVRFLGIYPRCASGNDTFWVSNLVAMSRNLSEQNPRNLIL
jgi:hypothetical protein